MVPALKAPTPSKTLMRSTTLPSAVRPAGMAPPLMLLAGTAAIYALWRALDGGSRRAYLAAGADIMNGQYRIVSAHRPAAVNNFLATSLHFRVTALH